MNTRQPLYLGLAVDLATRFGQHNGLRPCPPEGCKFTRIQDYFSANDLLGYSVLLQSPLDQPIIARNRGDLGNSPNPDVQESIELVEAGRDRIILAEGALIEACVQQIGARPPWNRIGGSQRGQRRARIEHFEFVCWLTGQLHPPFVARRTLRQLSAEPVHEGFEEDLHAARMEMMRGLSWEEALRWLTTMGGISAMRMTAMQNEGYLQQRAPFE